VTTPRAVIDSVAEAVLPASRAQAAGVRQRIGGAELGAVGALAERLAAARHAPRPVVDRKTLVVVAADHGIADPGVDLGDDAPTVVALRHLAGGGAAVNAAARTAGAQLVLVDCGIRGGGERNLGPGVLRIPVCDGTADLREGVAMTPIEAVTSVQTGIALALSIADAGVDVLGLGQVSIGSPTVAGAIIAAVCGNAADFDDADRVAIEEALDVSPGRRAPLELLTAFGGPDIGVLTGLMLSCASINVPVILDDAATWAAALIAANLAPEVTGYLIAAHAGGSPAHRAALDELGLAPLFDLGLARGEGTGAALALPLVDAAARLLADNSAK